MLLFLQSNAVARRLSGVNSRFSADDEIDQEAAYVVLALLVVILFALVMWRFWRWSRWERLAGIKSFGLDKKDLRLWWGHLANEQKIDPKRIFDSRERFCAQLTHLINEGETELARRVHDLWLSIDKATHERKQGLANLILSEKAVLRNADGRRLLDGFIRRLGKESLDVVPYSKSATNAQDAIPEQVHLERASGEIIPTRVYKIAPNGFPWTLTVGPGVDKKHERHEYRVKLTQEALLFPALENLKKIRQLVTEPITPTHHLLAKNQKNAPPSYEGLMRQYKVIYESHLVECEDLSALGVRIHMTEVREDLQQGQTIYLFIPFDIDGQHEDYLVSAQIVETWFKPRGMDMEPLHVLRCQFLGIRDIEFRRLRQLVNRIGQVDATKIHSRAAALAEEFAFNPLV